MCIAPAAASAAASSAGASSAGASSAGGFSSLMKSLGASKPTHIGNVSAMNSLSTGSIGKTDGSGISASGATTTGLEHGEPVFSSADHEQTGKNDKLPSHVWRTYSVLVTGQRTRDAILGQQITQYGASGITLDGTPTTVISRTAGDFAGQQFVDDLNTKFQTEMMEWQRKTARRQAFIGMGQSLLSVFGSGAGR